MQFSHGRFYVPFQKVDKEKRIVWGIAQTEDPDTQDDLLKYEASVKAFTEWAGNVREMHDPKAVGRAVKIICDPDKKQILVGTYISKGAEDTWQKVLDGTLRGYSIGGRVIDGFVEFIKNLGRSVRVVTSYVLDELSLVDTPANSLCVITAVTKRGTSLVATDVLGSAPWTRVASDVLSHSQGVSSMATSLRKRVKPTNLVKFAKNLDEKDGVIVARISDFTKNAAGDFVLKSTAAAATLTKGELEADGLTDEADDATPEVPVIDFGEHAENAAHLHKDMCKMAGIDDHEAHYAQATGEDGDGDELPGDEGQEDEFGKSRGSRRTRRSFAKRNGGDQFAKLKQMLDESNNALAKAFDAKLAEVKGTVAAAPRKGAEGEVVTKGAAEILNGTEGENANQNALTKMKSELSDLYTKRDDMLHKRGPGAKLDTAQRKEGELLAKKISQLETALAAASASVS